MASTDRTDDRAGPGPAVLASLVAVLGVVYAVVSRVAWRAFPFSGDEYSYFLQAEIFARGQLRAPAPPGADLLGIDHVVIDQWVRSKYPPGTSAMLALGVRAGVGWLVTPLEGVVALGLVAWTARALFGRKAALASVVVLGLSPLFTLEAATFYAHTATTLWLAACLAAVTAWSLSRRDGWLLAAGAALGCAFLTRPFDALLLGAALVALRSWRVLLGVGAGASPMVLAHFAYQRAVFGSPWTDGYTAYEPTFRAVYGADASGAPLSVARIVDPLQQWFHLDICASFLGSWTLPGAALLAVFGAVAIGRGHPGRPLRDVAVAVVVVSLVALVPTVSSSGDDGPRPRYLSTALLAIALLAGPGWPLAVATLSGAVGARVTRLVTGLAVALGVVQVTSLCIDKGLAVRMRTGLYDAVEAAGVTEGVVVVRARYPTRFARNGPFFDRPVLYLSAPGSMGVDDVAERYPARAIYEASEGDPWTVSRRK